MATNPWQYLVSVVGKQGPSGTATLPNDVTANSVTLAPVSGDSTAVGFSVNSSSGSPVFSVNATGSITAAVGAMFSGAVQAASAAVTGAVTAASATLTGALSAASATLTGASTAAAYLAGAGSLTSASYGFNGYAGNGIYLATASTSAAVIGFAVNGTQVATLAAGGLTLPGFLKATGNVYGGQFSPLGAYAANTGMTFQNVGSQGSETILLGAGGVSVGQISSSGPSFSQPLVMGTGASIRSPAYYTSTAGTAGAPIFAQYGVSPASGLYFPATGAVGLSAGGTQAFSSTSSATTLPLPTTVSQTLSVYGAATLSQTLNVTGATTLSQAVTTASTVTSTTAAGTPSFVSTQGFKQTIPMGTYWSSNTGMSTTLTPLVWAIENTGATGSNFMAATWVAPFPGSILALSGYMNNSIASGSVTMYAAIANSTTTLSVVLNSTTGPQGAYATKAKNAVTFTAGQLIQVFIQGSTSSINQSFSASITVEMAA